MKKRCAERKKATTREEADILIVLIVEPESGIADLIASVVELEGATPVLASDGYEAMALVRSCAPALVTTALLMPHMRGDALVAAIRLERGANLPVILISGSPYAEMLAVGADAMLTKPFSVTDLQSLLKRYLVAVSVDQQKGTMDPPRHEPFEQDEWSARSVELLHILPLKAI